MTEATETLQQAQERLLAMRSALPVKVAKQTAVSPSPSPTVTPSPEKTISFEMANALRYTSDTQKRINARSNDDRFSANDWLGEFTSQLQTAVIPTPEATKTQQAAAPSSVFVNGEFVGELRKRKINTLYRYLLEGRAIPTEKRGSIDRAYFETYLVNTHGFTGQRVHQIINGGNGVVWDIGTNGRIYLYADRRIAKNQGIGEVGGHFVKVALPAITDSMLSYNAHMYFAYPEGKEDRKQLEPETRAEIQIKTDCTPKTQRKYERFLGVTVLENIVYFPPEDKELAEKNYGRACLPFVDYEGQQFGVLNQQITRVQLANSYETGNIENLKRASKAKTRRLNKAIKPVEAKALAMGSGNNQIFCKDAAVSDAMPDAHLFKKPIKATQGAAHGSSIVWIARKGDGVNSRC